MSFTRSVLSNGVRVVTERHSYSKALSVGFFVEQGTRDEADDMVGAAHFVEHMVFKGTLTRDALEISKSLEKLGGELNAYTSREETCFHATCLYEHMPIALDVLADLMCNAEFDANEFRKEREVINQEILMTKDDVEEYIYDVYFEKAYGKHPMARPILGTQTSLGNISRKKLHDFYKHRYFGENMVVAVTGQVEHEEVCNLLEKSLRTKKKTKLDRAKRRRPTKKGFIKALNRNSEQCHLLVGLPNPSAKSPNRFASYVVNAALGGGMTSRLYQKVREKRGLCYSIYSSMQPASDSGVLNVYAGTSKKNIDKVTKLVVDEVHRMVDKGLRPQELRDYKRQVIGEIILEAESVESRMQSIGSQEMLFSRQRPLDDIVRDVEAVDNEAIKECSRKFFDVRKLGMVVIGDINEDRTTKMLEGLNG